MHPLEWYRLSPTTIVSDTVGDRFALVDLESTGAFCTIIGKEVLINRPNVQYMIAKSENVCAAMQTAAHVLHAMRIASENRGR